MGCTIEAWQFRCLLFRFVFKSNLFYSYHCPGCGILSVLTGGATLVPSHLLTHPCSSWCFVFLLALVPSWVFHQAFPLALSLGIFSRFLCLISILSLCSLLFCWNLGMDSLEQNPRSATPHRHPRQTNEPSSLCFPCFHTCSFHYM